MDPLRIYCQQIAPVQTKVGHKLTQSELIDARLDLFCSVPQAKFLPSIAYLVRKFSGRPPNRHGIASQQSELLASELGIERWSELIRMPVAQLDTDVIGNFSKLFGAFEVATYR